MNIIDVLAIVGIGGFFGSVAFFILSFFDYEKSPEIKEIPEDIK